MMNEPRKSVTQMCADSLRHRQIREVSLGNVSRKWGRIQDDPAGVGAPMAGSSHEPPRNDEIEVALTVPSVGRPSDSELQSHAITLLDEVRSQYESARINRLRYMQLARKYGLSCMDIGSILGITESAVRKALAKAGDLD